MKPFLISQAIFTFVGTAAAYLLLDPQRAMSYGVGSIVVLGNFAILMFVWKRIFQKKQIALAVSLIVIKYALLGGILYIVLRTEWAQPIWLGVGLGTLIFSTLMTSLFFRLKAF